ncbi:MAG TPA: nickel pincer cofactor biosynthesis protein LarC [Coriobacteriia bacterium]
MFAFIDCFSGASGDKFLGALVGVGLDPEVLRRQLALLDVGGYTLEVSEVRKAGMAGVKVDVVVEDGQRSRDWRAIRELITASRLSDAVKRRALDVFGRLAVAEAAAHGVEVDAVHFHEVGAVDSIVDIVGTAIGVVELGIDEIWATPVRLGRGMVSTSHGMLPIPAPATAELLRGVPVYAGELDGEMTTPTGAALLRSLVTRYAPMPPMTIASDGWGAGTWDLPIPNLLRLTLGTAELGGGGLTEIAVLQSSIDHVTAELLAATLDIALAEGALDAWADPISMKKGRVGTEITVLARIEDAARLTDLLMLHTGTLGVRRTITWRQIDVRRVETVSTTFGTVRVKVQGTGASLRVRPENDDVVAIARSSGLPLDRVVRMLTEQAETVLRERGSDAP